LAQIWWWSAFSVAVSRSKEVPVFGPPIHEGATFPKSKAFSDFLLAKGKLQGLTEFIIYYILVKLR
jgi:hypothetical protein